MTKNENIFTLNKNIWTQDDYELMGWHDCRIYGLIFSQVNANGTVHLVFDIDYIFQWVNPIFPNNAFSFWVAPCSLAFKEVFDLVISISTTDRSTDILEIADIHLVSKSELSENKWIYEWEIELQEGEIKFKSLGFEQIVRQKPLFKSSQILNFDERNGISFSLTPCTL